MDLTVLFQLPLPLSIVLLGKKFQFQLNNLFSNKLLGCVWHWLKKLVFFTLQFIFATIHGSDYTF